AFGGSVRRRWGLLIGILARLMKTTQELVAILAVAAAPSQSKLLPPRHSPQPITTQEVAMKRAFDHIGIPTLEPRAGESWVEFSRVWVTNPRWHPQRLEYIRPQEPPRVPAEQAGPWKLWHRPHVAYRVDDLRAALAGKELIFGPFDPGGFGQ